MKGFFLDLTASQSTTIPFSLFFFFFYWILDTAYLSNAATAAYASSIGDSNENAAPRPAASMTALSRATMPIYAQRRAAPPPMEVKAKMFPSDQAVLRKTLMVKYLQSKVNKARQKIIEDKMLFEKTLAKMKLKSIESLSRKMRANFGRLNMGRFNDEKKRREAASAAEDAALRERRKEQQRAELRSRVPFNFG